IPSLKNNRITTLRNLKLSSIPDKYERPVFLLNDKKWMDPVTEKPKIGDTEVCSFMNITDFPHPIHIHLIQFQVLNRQAFDLDVHNERKQIVLTGAPATPDQNERGWTYTISARPGEFTRDIVKFGPYAGCYVWPCHIVEHEEYDMMRPYDVIE